jgi:hypothetical protein
MAARCKVLKVTTNCFYHGVTCKGSTFVGSRVLWTRHEFGIRILKGLIVLMLGVITNLAMCSGRNFNMGEISSI